MKASLPLWALPIVLVLLGVALFFGRFSAAVMAAAGVATLAAVGYLAFRGRIAGGRRPPADLLTLLPGHLLLLFGLGTLRRPDALGLVWVVLPAGSLAYDALGTRPVFRGQRSILSGLYGILWLVVFFLLERLIAERKGLSGHAEVVAAVAFGAIGLVFVLTGIARHRRVVKE